jgi:hypothetical protein
MHLSLRNVARGGRRAQATAVVLALASGAIVAGPAAAATSPTSDYGNTVECRYQAGGHGPAYDWRINKLVVTPPVVYANSGTQTVGWKFVVTRSKNDDNGPWKITYRSPVQKASATTTHAAAFSSKSVEVAIPAMPENVTFIRYEVTLKLFWYGTDGSVQSQQSYLMPWMKSITNGHYYGDYDNDCQAGFYEGP